MKDGSRSGSHLWIVAIGIFSAASQAVAIPTGVQIFCFIATLLIGRVTKSVSLLFVLAGLATFIIGGLTGVMVAIAPFDYQAHDTYFIVSHLHYVVGRWNDLSDCGRVLLLPVRDRKATQRTVRDDHVLGDAGRIQRGVLSDAHQWLARVRNHRDLVVDRHGR